MAYDKISIPRDLLAAVLARPDEDAPREACAVALDKIDPVRADLIRTQLAQASRPREAGDPDDYEDADFLARRVADWAGPLHRWMPPPEHYHGPGFVRGIIEYLAMSAEDFLSQIGSIRQDFPIRHIDIVGQTKAVQLQRLLSGPELSGLSSLLIKDATMTAEAIEALAASPYVSGLGWFSYHHGKIGSKGITTMAASALLPSLWYFEPGDRDEDPRLRWQDDMGVPVGTEEPEALEMLEGWYGPIPWLHPAFEDSQYGIDHLRRVLGKNFHRNR